MLKMQDCLVRVVKDAVFTNDAKSVARLRVASKGNVIKDENGEYVLDENGYPMTNDQFYDVKLFGKNAQTAVLHFNKGRNIFLKDLVVQPSTFIREKVKHYNKVSTPDGGHTLVQASQESQDVSPHWVNSLEIIANSYEFVDSKSK
jgi:hypothetical protein